MPNFQLPFFLQTDASLIGLGSVLFQTDMKGTEQVVAYASRKLQPAQTRYHATERELLAVVWSINKFRHYLEGLQFTLITDSSALQWLRRMKDSSSKLTRWAIQLQGFTFEVKHRKGVDNKVADALSRHPITDTSDHLDADDPDSFEDTISRPCQSLSISAIKRVDPTSAVLDFSFTDVFEKPKLAKAQDADQKILALKTYLQSSALPTIPKLARRIKRNADRYMVSEDVVYRLHETRPCRHEQKSAKSIAWLPVIPDSLRPRLLRVIHDDPTAGHLGIDKTLECKDRRLLGHPHPRRCEKCQAYKCENQSPAELMGTLEATEP